MRVLFFTSALIFLAGIGASMAMHMAVPWRGQPLLAAAGVVLVVISVGLAWGMEWFSRFMWSETMAANADLPNLPAVAQLSGDAIAFVAGAVLPYLRPHDLVRSFMIALAALFAMHLVGMFVLQREAPE